MAFNSQFLKMNIGFKMSLTTHFENNFRKAIKYIIEYNVGGGANGTSW